MNTKEIWRLVPSQPEVPAKPTIGFVDPIPAGHARELHGREALCVLEDHFGWRRTRRELMVALWEELHERENCATRPMALDPVANVRPRPLWVPAWEVV